MRPNRVDPPPCGESAEVGQLAIITARLGRGGIMCFRARLDEIIQVRWIAAR
ncbi:MAG: hypothetical protein KGM43_19470 [Planctomycetota bacterium]|nr:hypothetical protein [Planctomycetota bacterium]